MRPHIILEYAHATHLLETGVFDEPIFVANGMVGAWCRYGGALGIDGNETLTAINVVESRFVNNLASVGGT